MPTTTIRLDDELKARVAATAERHGKTPHAFIVEAIASVVEQAETEAAFHRLADDRWAEIVQTKKSVPWSEAKAYLEARARGEKVKRPAARSLKKR
jgi:predicted transcriptional regulator